MKDVEHNCFSEEKSPEDLNNVGKEMWIFVTFMVRRKIQVYSQYSTPVLC